MYFCQLLERERELKIRIEHLENEITIIKKGFIPSWLEHKNIDDVDSAIVDAKIALKEVHNQMRQLLFGE